MDLRPKVLWRFGLLFALLHVGAARFAVTANAQLLTRDRPVEAGTIKIGMSNAQSGRLGYVGVSVKRGCEAYFARVNSEGGVYGRRLVLVDYDDGYEPLNAVSNTEKLINQDRVFALLGFVGTPTCSALLSMLNEANIVLVGPITGAGILRDPWQPLVFNTRASYADETEVLVKHLTNDLGITRVALFRQNDSYGQAGKDGVLKALHQRGLDLVTDGTYIRNSVDIEAGLDQIVRVKPEAVILIGAYKPCAEFIKKAKKRGLSNAVFCNVSFVGTEPLIKFLDSDGDGVVVSQVLPSPQDRSLPFVGNYQTDMRQAGYTQFDYASLEGYLDALILVSGLRQAGADLTQQGFQEALENVSLEFGPFQIKFSRSSREGTHTVFLTRIEAGVAKPVDTLTRAPAGR
ncbi:MAG: ABC transporter substrate-binding protein [Chthoniobacterales bacterium]